ncbi:hypothetical protein D2V17_13080 [Aurantiacibacter xanthus]|uniref:DUF5672 domain-containing protein n=2 Tax=Aurantiacibacter xanthus TaxID=1784712 RepID=A0A3A1P6F6_9SPHN|nr:hypothetical protein D2V17_13080 [Aurantiacibacter xanthus]
MAPAPGKRLHLPSITLCAVSSTNLPATIEALRICMQYVDFADVILCTHDVGAAGDAEGAIRVVPIERLTSARAYSQFMLTRLVDHIATEHCLVVQWDGHVIDPAHWQPEFLDYDYVGASWPQFDDGREVGNGGFSLRSKRLMEACRTTEFEAHHPEDVAICRTNRALLEQQGMRFAPVDVADAFAAERAGDPTSSFGYHGVFLMPQVLGVERFWRMYCALDERGSLRPDFWDLLRTVWRGNRRTARFLRMLSDGIADTVR